MTFQVGNTLWKLSPLEVARRKYLELKTKKRKKSSKGVGVKLEDKVLFGNYPFMLIFYPLILLLRFIGWLKNPYKFCKHEWEAKKLKATYGVFGGMEVYQ